MQIIFNHSLINHGLVHLINLESKGEDISLINFKIDISLNIFLINVDLLILELYPLIRLLVVVSNTQNL